MSVNYDRAIKELIKKRKRSKHMGATAAITIILLLTGIKLSSKRGYIIPDRIDIQCEIQAVPFAQLSQMQPGEPSAAIRERVIRARQIQTERFSSIPKQGGQGRPHCNAQMTERMLHEFAEPNAASLDMLRMAMERLKLSARAYSRILKVARTIADLAGSEKVESMHIAEAIGYRNLDRGDWAERGM
jgi:magnesium chelatase family protein